MRGVYRPVQGTASHSVSARRTSPLWLALDLGNVDVVRSHRCVGQLHGHLGRKLPDVRMWVQARTRPAQFDVILGGDGIGDKDNDDQLREARSEATRMR